jgi:hypothetical protein
MGLHKIGIANHYLYDGVTLSPTRFLASDIDNPLLPALFIGPLLIGLLGLLVFAIKRPRASAIAPRRSRTLLVVGLTCTIIGGLLSLILATTRGGAPPFFYLAALLPLLIGLRILAKWSRPNRS